MQDNKDNGSKPPRYILAGHDIGGITVKQVCEIVPAKVKSQDSRLASDALFYVF
jgi:hypothetical protein